MTGSGRYRFYYATSENDLARAGTRTPISRKNLLAAEWRLRTLTTPATPPDPWAQDLWDIVIGIHIADRLASRDEADDRWTRWIDIDLPVSDPAPWTPAARELLTNLLEVSTGDNWTISLRPQKRSSPIANPEIGQDGAETRADHVALFSGGLDSTVYAAHMARTGSDTLFVTFTRPRLRPVQDVVFKAIQDLASTGPLRRVAAIPMDPCTRRPSSGLSVGSVLERSSRSRGLLYATTAVYIGAAFHAATVAIPENGQLAINPPLSPARSSTCSTRSAHPWVLHQINALIAELGGDLEVINPLLNLTKGEVCDMAWKEGLGADTLFSTISCGKPPFFRSPDKPEHCGLCVACLMRRSGLLNALGYDNTKYLCAVPEKASSERAADIAALARWLDEPFGLSDLLADSPLPRENEPHKLMQVLTRGRTELSNLLQSFSVGSNCETRLEPAR